jgi:glycosyltransferase involved in cell wall biosynthesis
MTETPRDSDARVLVYATYDGVNTMKHGIGTQTQYFLSAAARYRNESWSYGWPDLPDDVVVAYPEPLGETPDYLVDEETLRGATAAAEQARIRFAPLPFRADNFWRAATWYPIVEQLTEYVVDNLRGRELLIVAIDAVFLAISESRYLDRMKSACASVAIVHGLYSSARQDFVPVDPDREALEVACIDRVNTVPDLYVGDLTPSFTEHLVDAFGLTKATAPMRQSIELTDPDFSGRYDPRYPHLVERAFPDLGPEPVVVYGGRADPAKGFDMLVDAIALCDMPVQLAATLVGYRTEDDNVRMHLNTLAKSNISASIHVGFSRELLMALSWDPRVVAWACPSRCETVGALPQEVPFWGRESGPVIVATPVGGLKDQVVDGYTGMLAAHPAADALSDSLRRALTLSDQERAELRARARLEVRATRNFQFMLAEFLTWCERHIWPAGRPSR